MKSQKEIYEALLDGKILVTQANFYVKLDEKSGDIVTSNDRASWHEDMWSFSVPEDWQIYIEPKEPMTLECEVEWGSREYIIPIGTNLTQKLTPFIGKRTKMTLVEILEDDK